jgi:ketosteroid isomerase-like protein
MQRKIFLLAAAPLLVAASPSWKGQALAAAASSIDKANDEWTRAIVTGHAAVLCAPYDANGIFIAPNGAVVRGKAAVCDMYAKRPSGVKVLRASIHSDGRVAADPNDVYEWGSAQMTVERNGKQRMSVGRYLTVWHRTGKQWLISHNIAF